MMPAMMQRWQKANDEATMLHSLASARSGMIGAVAKSLRMILQIAIMGTGGYLALKGEMTAGGIIACSILSGRALSPFEQAIGAWGQLKAYQKSRSRLQQQLLRVPPRKDTLSLPEPKGTVVFEKVVYAAPNTPKAILKGINFTINAGEAIGIVGPSGAGKSTMVKLMVGVWRPNSGTVRLDSADVFTWKREEFGRHIGYLPQDVELFEGTVKENIARMQEDVNDELVIRAAKLAGVHDLILHLPEGYETNIGVGGTSLSAGQRQRIGLARAFFGDPRLVVLDEPNSNLDEMGEQSLLAAMRNAKQLGMTTVIISHRPSILTYVDKVMVVQDGMVTDYGPTREIMTKYSKGSQQRRTSQTQVERERQARLQAHNQAENKPRPAPGSQQPGGTTANPAQENTPGGKSEENATVGGAQMRPDDARPTQQQA